MSEKKRGLSWEEILANTAGERLLIRFCQAVEGGTYPSADDMLELAKGFRAILSGDAPKKALSLSRGKGRPKRTAAEADEELARVYPMIKDILERRAAGKTQEIAIEEAAERWGVPEGSLSDYYKRQRHAAELLMSVEKGGFAKLTRYIEKKRT